MVPAAPEPPRLTADTVRARIERCFKRASEEGGSSSLRVSVVSTLHIELNGDGSYRSGRFADGTGHIEIPVSFGP